MGVLVSIAGTVCVGLSVDYVLHLGFAFAKAPESEGISRRHERFASSMGTMGSTVLAGAITTCAAALALQACTLRFFQTGGGLIATSVGVGLLYSFFCFMPLCAFCGPSELDRHRKRRILRRSRTSDRIRRMRIRQQTLFRTRSGKMDVEAKATKDLPNSCTGPLVRLFVFMGPLYDAAAPASGSQPAEVVLLK